VCLSVIKQLLNTNLLIALATLQELINVMAKKGSAKNTKNKAKHAKLIIKKRNKLAKEKQLKKERLKLIKAKSSAQKTITDASE